MIIYQSISHWGLFLVENEEEEIQGVAV